MSREERHTSPGFDTGPVREGSEEKTGSEMARGWPKVTQQVGERSCETELTTRSD